MEGWVVIATNIHEEAMDDHVNDAFADYGVIKNTQFNLDHRTGYAKVRASFSPGATEVPSPRFSVYSRTSQIYLRAFRVTP